MTPTRRPIRVSPKPMIETLEPRRLLSASVVEGTLTVTGTKYDDLVILSSDGGQVLVQFNSDLLHFDVADVQHIVVNGGKGSDIIIVDDGNGLFTYPVTMNGDAGNDTLAGGGYDDIVCGGAGTDIMYGFDGHDVMRGQAGNDIVDGGTGDDDMRGGVGNDELYAAEGNDVVHGGGGDDYLDGGDGNDSMFGGAGMDRLDGGLGDDQLSGGCGMDTLTGGDGADTFLRGDLTTERVLDELDIVIKPKKGK